MPLDPGLAVQSLHSLAYDNRLGTSINIDIGPSYRLVTLDLVVQLYSMCKPDLAEESLRLVSPT